eukprot:TRINITY_DN106955_c0_g1_i1.p1 TRINITY_DN106955_c0_g1~~TRINITY_DN106955_c0_g1_i1.p1  ORF type:complete len:592 (-),score=78.72 TRINITY_DN106955_c0_g1_i1:57-1832(-)
MMAAFEATPPLHPHITLQNCNEIVDNLYLGGIAAAIETQSLVDQGIHAVVCCVRETEFPTCDFHKDLAYYRVDVEDIPREPIELFWPEATQFIHDKYSKGFPVLVHCRAGVSRSASTVIAYLVAYQGYSLNEAFVLARKKRPVVTPNLGFMEKLCEFEESVCKRASTIDLQKYESWYNGTHLAEFPDVGTGSYPISADSFPASSAFADTSTVTHHGARKMHSALQKLKIMRSLSCTDHKDQVDLDVPSEYSGSQVLDGRLRRVRSLCIRQAAHDPDLGYCQGMHLVAAVFVAASDSHGEAYWRFHAFLSSVRSLWLPGFPLLEQGVSHFETIAQQRPWYKHMCAHQVQPSMYLPQAWLGLFTAWLELTTLVECMQLLEGNGLLGILCVTLAVLDHLNALLLQQNDQKSIMEVLVNAKDMPWARSGVLQKTRQLLAQVSLASANRSEATVYLNLSRRGSRVVNTAGIEILAGLPPLSVLVSHAPAQGVGHEEEGAGKDGMFHCSSSNPGTTQCLSWCSGSLRSVLVGNSLQESTRPRRKVRASIKLHEQQAEFERVRNAAGVEDTTSGTSHRDAREQARKRRSILSWSHADT